MAAIFAHWLLRIAEWSFLLPTVGGSVYAVLSLLAVIRLRTRRKADAPRSEFELTRDGRLVARGAGS